MPHRRIKRLGKVKQHILYKLSDGEEHTYADIIGSDYSQQSVSRAMNGLISQGLVKSRSVVHDYGLKEFGIHPQRIKLFRINEG